ncbi:MAG: DUF2330 domain-containing protein, partial [Sandaracinaceae bacterium]|nr:DUF2330 domain-containing protein [Sandaracinaceae bacterium]
MLSAVFGGMRHVPLAVAASALALLPARPALACGGFFCSSSPINQSKEIIVYGLEDDGTVTMSVQVQYQGRDEDFAWILPLPAPPTEIGVGDDALFQALSQATSPIFTLEERMEGTCRASPMCTYPSYGGGCSLGCASYSAAPRDFADAGSALQADAGVRVYSEATIGPYDTVVLGASAAATVIDWLQTNGYDVPASSERLLEPYAAQGHVFVALRLTANRLSSVLRPITVRMPTSEACLPIRLTPIATTPTLPIEAYFLGRAQVRSSNYSTAEIELAPNLWRGTLTYDEAVRQRVQALGGRAFATDYAGAVPDIAITIPSVLVLETETDPARFLQGLSARGLSGTRLLSDLFDAYLTPPSGEDTVSYLNCLASGSTSSCGTPIRFDAAGLARAI